MIRQTATTDTSSIDAQMALLESHDKVVAETGQAVVNRHAPDALAEFKKEPGPVKKNSQGKIDWTSDKQRIKVMILRREKGIKGDYERSHELSEGWTITAKIDGAIFKIVIQNPSPIAKFVYGSLAQDQAAAKRFQQQFHINTGWQAASEIATRWTKIMLDSFKELYREKIVVKRRAYTGRTRKS